MALILLDTNVLVYLFDRRDLPRQQRAIEVLRVMHATGAGCLSVQCLAEFCAVVTRGNTPLLTPADALTQASNLARSYTVYSLTPMIVAEAIRGVRDYRLAYYDAQIWAIARLNQIQIVFSEDFHHGVLEGVRFVDPFATEFSLTDWV